MTIRRRSIARLTAVVMATAVFATACGGPPAASVDPGERPALAVTNAASLQLLPEVTVWDIGAKDWVQFANFLPADKPLLVWFWAPH